MAEIEIPPMYPIEIDPQRYYRCVMSYWAPAGNYPRGRRLQGSHIGVQSNPKFWVDADLDEEQELFAFNERFGIGTFRGSPDAYVPPARGGR